MNNDTYSAKAIHGTYYPHIDGIRALAVLPVVLYHIFASLCPGGFAGVDVFFVISGYLITGGILRDLQKDRFSIRHFYHRRIRRIFPAYFTLIAGVFAVGCAIYYSCPLRDLGDASISGSLFSANLYFRYLGDNYFSPTIKGSPLLHLWSLSVEEQFYLCIPLLCFVLWRYCHRWVAPVLVTITILSLAGAMYSVGVGKQGDAFFFLHFRAWELLTGALLAMLPAVLVDGSTKGARQSHLGLSWAGLMLVLAPYALLTSATPFPGAAAISSVVGTALLIRYGQTGWIHKLLSFRPFVGTGKISYSLYLWHWPVTVFWRYIVYDQLVVWDYTGMFVVSITLAYLSWRFVEMPVRTSPAWTMPRTFAFATAGISALVFMGVLCVFNKGWPTYLHPTANALAASVNQQYPGFLGIDLVPRMTKKVGRLLGRQVQPETHSNASSWSFAAGESGTYRIGNKKPPGILVIGDCHAGVLMYGLDIGMSEHHLGGEAVIRNNVAMYNMGNPSSQDALAKLAALPDVSKVFLAQYWLASRERHTARVMFDQLEDFALRIKKMHKTLYVATDVPVYPNTPSDIHARLAIIPPRKMKNGWDGVQSEVLYEQRQGEINAKLQDICRKTGAILIPLHLALKDGDHYITTEYHYGRLIPLYRNSNNLSTDGSLRAARFLMPYLYPEEDHAVKKSHRSDPSNTSDQGDSAIDTQPQP